MSLPNRRFNRSVGLYAGTHFDLEGNPISEEEWERNATTWLPTAEDKAYVKSLMQPCLEPGKIASWIAPPAKGVNSQPAEFEYVRL